MNIKPLPPDQTQVLFVVDDTLKSGFFYNFADESDDINDTTFAGFQCYKEHRYYSVSKVEKWIYLEEVRI